MRTETSPAHVEDLYESWFLDYASYVILDRAVPHIKDGLKPVQRRILYALWELDDGRLNKAANVIGHTMRYHPHGDMAIEDALVKIAQKDLLIDTQGNWGNIFTGDRAAASRYIEARLSALGKEILFNEDLTEWQASYDGRNREPLHLPVKFPLLLALGVEGIAVGLQTKILPHNFAELCDVAIQHLQGKAFTLLPDFPSGGLADFSNYQEGRRGGRVRVRSRIRIVDSRTLQISDLPYGTSTVSLIESILTAHDKGKIKVKRVEDNTGHEVDIRVHLPSGVSAEQTMEALYAFTDCEVSISVNCCVIQDEKPAFSAQGTFWSMLSNARAIFCSGNSN
jgi:topoisomerase-4 subunit A